MGNPHAGICEGSTSIDIREQGEVLLPNSRRRSRLGRADHRRNESSANGARCIAFVEPLQVSIFCIPKSSWLFYRDFCAGARSRDGRLDAACVETRIGVLRRVKICEEL